MTVAQFSDPLIAQTLEKHYGQLDTYLDDLESLEISKEESARKLVVCENALNAIELELARYTAKKVTALNERNTAKEANKIIEARTNELLSKIEKLKLVIKAVEEKPVEKSAKTTRRGAFLKKMDHVMPWGELISLIQPIYPNPSNNKNIDREIKQKLRLYYLQQWFNLSNIALEELLFDSVSMRDFAGIAQNATNLPDAAQIEEFQRILETDDVKGKLKTKTDQLYKENSLMITGGSIIDASAVSLVSTQPKAKKDGTAAKTEKVKGNKFSFLDSLAKYGDPKELLTEIVTELHKTVVEKKETRHYLFNSSVENLLSDQFKFVSYVFPKEKITQSNPITQTAPPAMRIGTGPFDEIAHALTFMLVDWFKVERKIAPTMTAHILELVEETRCQIEDFTQSMWKPVELKGELLDRFFSQKGYITRKVSESEVAIIGGAELPFNIIIDTVTKNLVIKAMCKANEWSNLDEIQTFANELNEKTPALHFEVEIVNLKPVMTTEYYLPYRRGVPHRLLLKVCKAFTLAIAKCLEQDERNLMVKAAGK